MADFVVDASAALAWFFRDEAVGWGDALFQQLRGDREALAPRHWPLEVANSFVIAMRRGWLARQALDQNLDALRSLSIYIDMAGDAAIFTSMVALAQTHGLSVYDAAYLELAIRSRLPLATLDDDLRSAAVSSGITVLK
jgi:predicted nucleic acid-binding protein